MGTDATPRLDLAGLPARERILVVAGELFAREGYHRASTRDIAAGVGVRQPSLFHHFSSKAAILTALLEHSYGPTSAVAALLADRPGAAAPRLHAYLTWDLLYVHRSRYVLAGLHGEEVLGDPAFAAARAMAETLHAALRRMLDQGIVAGEFEPVDPDVLRELITSITLTHIRLHADTALQHAGDPRTPEERAAETARFVLRGLLREPGAFAGVARASAEVLLDLPVPAGSSYAGQPVAR